MNEVISILKDFAERLRAIPEHARNYGVTKKLTEELNEALPDGWEGYVVSNAVSVNKKHENPDELGREAEVEYATIYLHDIDDVKKGTTIKYPSYWCAYCGTPKIYFEGWECPTCGAV